MKRKPRPGKHTASWNGTRLRYALNEWQSNAVMEERMHSGRPEAEIADEWAHEFLSADLQADSIIDLVRRMTAGHALAVLDDLLKQGAVSPLVLVSVVNETWQKAEADSQRLRVTKRASHAKARDAGRWIHAQWTARTDGQFKTRDAFVEWCIQSCPLPIETDHDTIRDRWVPRGRASSAGAAKPRK